jgi:N-carbamoylputrescine amidase
MALMGAELLLYPTAIGSEPPPAPLLDSRLHWQRTQQGHAAANLMPLIASNRHGIERSTQDPQNLWIRFYGSSFIADATGAKVAEAGEDGDAVITATFDLEAIGRQRTSWGVFRDRRPDLYGTLATYDGRLDEQAGSRVGHHRTAGLRQDHADRPLAGRQGACGTLGRAAQ